MKRDLSDDFLNDIVQQYRHHIAAGQMPAPAIATTENANVRTVQRWLYEARNRGLLERGTPPDLNQAREGANPRRRSNDLGPVGHRVRVNLLRIRKLRGLTTERVSDLARGYGRPMIANTITKIEKGQRRVDVDDLAALAAALGVTPEQLMEEPSPCENCHGTPPPGFVCGTCGEGTAA